jgi:glycosyltransferase involved in cell wall biosynthesis
MGRALVVVPAGAAEGPPLGLWQVQVCRLAGWLAPLALWHLWRTLRHFHPDVIHVARAADLPLVRLTAALAGLSADAVTPLPEPSPPPEVVLPADAVVILCAGPLVRRAGVLEALWALDILRYVEPRARLLIAGDGPDRPRLEAFAEGLGLGGAVHFLGDVADVTPYLRRAQMVWAPVLSDEVPAVLRPAAQMGKPVIAADWPGLRAEVPAGARVTFVPAGDNPALARETRRGLGPPA